MTTYALATALPHEAVAFQHARHPMRALVSFYYYQKTPALHDIRGACSWVMDSGAYTAATMGATIDLSAYIETCLRLMEGDNAPAEIYGLDVIGDPEASLRNVDDMRAAGVPAIPTFHLNSPWHYLEHMAPRFDKIALGGMVRGKGKPSFIEQVFARVWPKRLHGFGLGSLKYLEQYPFHSVDSSTWTIGPKMFGYWRAYGMSVREGPRVPVALRERLLAKEIDAYARIEKKLRFRWRREMARLDALPSVEGGA